MAGHKWAQGESGNPNGRPKGTHNRIITDALKAALKVGEDKSELDDLIQKLLTVARDPEHKDFINANRLIWSRLQAELRHQMDSSEVASVSVLLEALGISSPSDRGRADDDEAAAE